MHQRYVRVRKAPRENGFTKISLPDIYVFYSPTAVEESLEAAAAMGTDFTCSKRSAAKCLALLYPDNG